MRPLAALLDGAAFPKGTPVAIARVDRDGAIEEAVGGIWPDGVAVTVADQFYGASLTKQVTGAAVAVLVRDGRLDPDAPVSMFVDDLPGWAERVTVRHLLHHLGGLPPPAAEDEVAANGDWTAAGALALVRWESTLPSAPGVAYSYSNVGYVLLAEIVAATARQPFASFVAERLFRPLGIEGMEFAGDDLSRFRQAPLLGSCRPLSHGDGGLWSTARGYAAWLHAQNEDRLGIAPLVTAPGRLTDGSPVDYGWGIAPRYHRNWPAFIHGGSWVGAIAFVMRSPHHRVSVAAFAAGGTSELIGKLVETAFDDATV